MLCTVLGGEVEGLENYPSSAYHIMCTDAVISFSMESISTEESGIVNITVVVDTLGTFEIDLEVQLMIIPSVLARESKHSLHLACVVFLMALCMGGRGGGVLYSV